MPFELYIVDAFTDRAFRGNPAAVVVLDAPADEAWMQSVATEMKHSETAFVVVPEGVSADAVLSLRWFTPTREVELCGHATLATAHVLGGSRRFHTLSGELRCIVKADGAVEMDFPADPPTGVPDDAPWLPELARALPGVDLKAIAYGVSDVLVEVASAAQVDALAPDFAAVARIPRRGVVVTAPGDRDGVDFVSRGFFPRFGIDEDPVTGSAHCMLACWWSPRLGRTELVGEQRSRRGGRVAVALRDDRIGLAGQAVTVLRGSLLV